MEPFCGLQRLDWVKSRLKDRSWFASAQPDRKANKRTINLAGEAARLSVGRDGGRRGLAMRWLNSGGRPERLQKDDQRLLILGCQGFECLRYNRGVAFVAEDRIIERPRAAIVKIRR